MKTMLTLTCCVFLLSGCSQTMYVSPTTMASNVQTTSPDELRYYEEGDLAPLYVQIIGHVYVEKNSGTAFGGVPDQGKLQKILRKQAASIGAEGIVGARYSRHTAAETHKFRMWGSGLAVTFLQEGQKSDTTDFTVAVFPPVIDPRLGLEASGELRASRLKNAMMKTAQYELDRRGYYSMLTSQDLEFGQELNSIPPQEHLDVQPALFLIMSIEGHGDTSAVIFEASESIMRMRLVSYVTREVVWEGSGGAVAVIGWLRALLGDDALDDALRGAVVATCSSLPARHGGEDG